MLCTPDKEITETLQVRHPVSDVLIKCGEQHVLNDLGIL